MATTQRSTKQKSDSGMGPALNVFVADTYVLLAKTQACHWNATGPDFYGFHKLTEAQYGELFEAVDVLAERVRALRWPAPSGLAAMLELSTLEEDEGITDTQEAARALARDHAAMADQARELASEAGAADDPATEDLLVARIEAHEKAAWLLRSHLP